MKGELSQLLSSWPLVRRRTSNGGHCKPRDQLITGITAFLAERREVHFRGKKWSQGERFVTVTEGFRQKHPISKNNVSRGRLWLISTPRSRAYRFRFLAIRRLGRKGIFPS